MAQMGFYLSRKQKFQIFLRNFLKLLTKKIFWVMAIKKVKFCDNCGKMIKEEDAYFRFPFYGWQGRIFCSDICLKEWALKVSEFYTKKPAINLDWNVWIS